MLPVTESAVLVTVDVARAWIDASLGHPMRSLTEMTESMRIRGTGGML